MSELLVVGIVIFFLMLWYMVWMFFSAPLIDDHEIYGDPTVYNRNDMEKK